jgi:signal transduction histidine kinase
VRTGWPRFGLQTMRERTEALGGEFELVSSPGRGTTVAMRIPLDKLVEAAR